MEKKVAILGGGHGAHAMAVDLISRGFSVNLFEMVKFKDNLQQLFQTKIIESTGAVEGKFKLAMVTSDIDKAIKDIKYISLVNLIMDREVVKELIQGEFNAGRLISELTRLISDDQYRSQMLSDLETLHKKLGGPGASEMAAQLIYQRLQQSK